MYEERVDVVINDRIAPTLIPKLRTLAAAAHGAAGATSQLRTATRSVGPVPTHVPRSLKATGAAAKGAKVQMMSLGVVMRTMFQVYFAYAAAQRIMAMADSYKELSNRLILVSDSSEHATDLLGALFTSAQRSRTDIEAMTTSFQRFDLALATMGRGQADSLVMTETIAKMLQLTGSTATEAASGMLQLSQAFNKGKLDGDEFRTVMETMPLVARALSKQLKITKKEMYAMAKSGELTADILADTIIKSAVQVNEEFKKVDKTIAQSFTQLQNMAIMSFGEMNERTKGTNGIVSIMDAITNSIDAFTIVLGDFIVVGGMLAETLGAISNAGATLPGYTGAYWKSVQARVNYTRSERELVDNLRPGTGTGTGTAVGRDTSGIDEYIEKMIWEMSILGQRVEIRENDLELRGLENQLARDGVSLLEGEREALHSIMLQRDQARKYSQEELRLHQATTVAWWDLDTTQRALTASLEEGRIGVEEYRGAWSEAAAEMIRVEAIMGSTQNTIGTGFRLALLQMSSELPHTVQAMADIIQEAFEGITNSIGDAVAELVVFREKFKMVDLFREVIAQMISSLVALTAQYMIVGIARRFAGMPAIGGGEGLSGSTGNALGTGAPGNSIRQFSSGGYTGGGSTKDVAGLVHGKEFVVNARATSKNRGALEAINSGKSITPNVVINNNAPGVTVSTEYVSKDEVRLIVEETVVKKAGTVVAREMGNPNSPVSRSMRANTTAGRRGV